MQNQSVQVETVPATAPHIMCRNGDHEVGAAFSPIMTYINLSDGVYCESGRKYRSLKFTCNSYFLRFFICHELDRSVGGYSNDGGTISDPQFGDSLALADGIND